MKKSVSKRKNTYRSVRRKNNKTMRKNNRSVRRKNNRSRKNNKLIGGGYSITYDLVNDKKSLKEKVLEEISKSGGDNSDFETTIGDLPLDDNNTPQEFTADQIKVEKTINEYSITVVKNRLGARDAFGFDPKDYTHLHSIKLANVNEQTLKELLMNALKKSIQTDLKKSIQTDVVGLPQPEEEEGEFGFRDNQPQPEEEERAFGFGDNQPSEGAHSHNKLIDLVSSNKEQILESIMKFFNLFTKDCTNAQDLEIRKAINYLKGLKPEEFTKLAQGTIKIKEETGIIFNDSLFGLLKQFLCLEPIPEKTKKKINGGSSPSRAEVLPTGFAKVPQDFQISRGVRNIVSFFGLVDKIPRGKKLPDLAFLLCDFALSATCTVSGILWWICPSVVSELGSKYVNENPDYEPPTWERLLRGKPVHDLWGTTYVPDI